MARSKRFEFRGAIHLVTLSGHAGGKVFYDPQIIREFPENPHGHAPETEYFESLLWEICDQYDARIHSYVIEPNSAMIIVQTLGAPLGWFVHDLLARFSMYLVERKRIPNGERPFPQRYKTQIVQPAKLPYAVRYIHRRELVADGHRRAINHPFSSSLIYCGRRSRPERFVVSATRDALERLGYAGPNAYFEFMAAYDSPAIADMLSRPVIGERRFTEFVHEQCRKPPEPPSLDGILRDVTGFVLHDDLGVLYSSTHRGALARALVAWYAMRTGTARISAVARRFGVTSSGLRYLIRRHRSRIPQYFSKSISG